MFKVDVHGTAILGGIDTDIAEVENHIIDKHTTKLREFRFFVLFSSNKDVDNKNIKFISLET